MFVKFDPSLIESLSFLWLLYILVKKTHNLTANTNTIHTTYQQLNKVVLTIHIVIVPYGIVYPFVTLWGDLLNFQVNPFVFSLSS